MPETITIRRAERRDAAAISALIHSLTSYFLVDPDDPAAAAPFFLTITPEALTEAIAGEELRYHVAEAAGELVGVVGIRGGSHLYHLFVDGSMHRRGIAGRLWETARADAVARGNAGGFTVNSSILAVPLYERLGFAPVSPQQEKNGIRFQPMELPAARTPG